MPAPAPTSRESAAIARAAAISAARRIGVEGMRSAQSLVRVNLPALTLPGEVAARV
jgi:hypothetical protein